MTGSRCRRAGREDLRRCARAGALLLGLGAWTCGGSGGSPAAATQISVGGAYSMAVALVQSDCAGVEVTALPTRVDHAPGATRFQLTHGPVTYTGTLAADGRFTTEPITVTDARGSISSIVLVGQFTTVGFEADATVAEQGPPPCRYVVHWIGTKQGPPNVIP